MGLKRDRVRAKADKNINNNKELEQPIKKVVEESIEIAKEVKNEPLSVQEKCVEEIIEENIKTPPKPNDEVIEYVVEDVIAEDDKKETNIDKEKELEELLKEEENMSDEDKKVICLDTLEVYLNSKDAESKTPAKAGAITRNCNKNSKRAGGLRWMYYTEYLQENL